MLHTAYYQGTHGPCLRSNIVVSVTLSCLVVVIPCQAPPHPSATLQFHVRMIGLRAEMALGLNRYHEALCDYELLREVMKGRCLSQLSWTVIAWVVTNVILSRAVAVLISVTADLTPCRWA